MRRIVLNVLSIALVMSSVVYGQSLGDVAKENREKQKAKAAAATAKPKVITNEDLPANSAALSDDGEDKTRPAPMPVPSGGMSAEQWKSLISSRKNMIAAQQAQIDKLNDSIHYVTASLYSNGLQHNENQAQKQQAVERLKQQLEEQKKSLADLQEAARQAGMGSAVYDP
jgi:predicted RNase H-like nuclease (RuvC/YqgF family)